MKKFALISMLVFSIVNSNAQVVINEFMASNTSVFADMVDYDDYSDWIELYNTGNESVNLSGYYLTDDLTNPVKWKIPAGATIAAKSCFLVWADGYDHGHTAQIHFFHTNFKLSADGEQIGLYDAVGNVVDTLSFGHQFSDISYGRINDGNVQWAFFGEPTPDASNSGLSYSIVEYAENPEFSLASGSYSGSQTLLLTAGAGSVIRYTTDGSKPTSSSAIFSGQIGLTQTTVVRARVFADGKIPGAIITKTYLINENTHGLPIISFTTFPENLWDPLKGIYVNEIKEREIPIVMDYFTKEGKHALSVNAGARLSGDASYIFPNKPFTIYARSKYGYDFLDYPFFENREMHLFKSIYLRNSGYFDNQYTMFRDGAAHSFTQKSVQIDCQSYQPAVMFLNGEYWGIYNMREKLNGDYFEHHYQIDEDEIDYLKYEWNPTPAILNGDRVEYNKFLLLVNSNLANNDLYERAVELIDLEEYVDYQISEICLHNMNWIDYNVRFWKKRQSNAKWRWVMTDVDYGLGMETGMGGVNFNLLEAAITWNTPAAIIFNRFLQNSGFKRYFIQRFASLLNSGYSSSNLLKHIDSLKANIAPEMHRHIEKWGNEFPGKGPYCKLKDKEQIVALQTEFETRIRKSMNLPDTFPFPVLPKSIHTYEEWEANVEVMRSFAMNNENIQRQRINDCFGLSGIARLHISVNKPKAGKVYTENIFITDSSTTGKYFKNLNLVVKAVPNVGYKFVSWEGISDATTPEILVSLDSESAIIANFAPVETGIVPDTVFNHLVLRAENSPYCTCKDIVIKPGAVLQIERGVEVQMAQSASIFVFGTLLVHGTNDSRVVIKPHVETGAKNWGAICFENASGTSVLNHLKMEGASKGCDFIRHFSCFSAYGSDLKMDNVEIETDLVQPFYSEYGNIEIKNSQFKSNIAGDLINLKYSVSALVQNCIFYGNDAIDADAIDYDQITNGQIVGNKIYGFFGFNSDGIDLGEDDKNILIKDNAIYNCFDKGISIGQASTALVYNNVFVNCGEGIGIKDDGSYALVDRNTFYGNKVAVASFEKNWGDGGGNVDMVNCIVANSIDSPVFADHLSVLNIKYSISDTEELEGENNLSASPGLVNPVLNDFSLFADSPCVNAGDPSSSPDPDGSRADIGAKYVFLQPPASTVMMTEICYNPALGANSGDWVEIFNRSHFPVDLSGWSFFDCNNSHVFNIQDGLVIQPNQYLVMVHEKQLFETVNPGINNFIYSIGYNLSNTGEALRLFDKEMNLVDLVVYSSEEPWPIASGIGTIQLVDTYLDNDFGQHWAASLTSKGTPGVQNATLPFVDFGVEQVAGFPFRYYDKFQI